MNNFIIKKWIEPYRLLETVKEYCECADYTFDGSNKNTQKSKMYSEIEGNNGKFALYMKNVNKFYVFKPKHEFDILEKLIDVFELTSDDYEINDDSENAIYLIDLGKSEASFINVNI